MQDRDTSEGPSLVASGMRQDGCFQACGHISQVTNIPNVLFVVDQSGSMLQASPVPGKTIWSAARDAVLPVVSALESKVNFGVASLVEDPAANNCPAFESRAIARNNAATITSFYAEGPAADRKWESPVWAALPLLPSIFAQATGTGPDIAVLVTDGEVDFCGDESSLCAMDATIAGVQGLWGNGIRTYVLGARAATIADSCPGALQAYANAGAAMSVANPCAGQMLTRSFTDECGGNATWKALAIQAGRWPNMPLGDYETTGGSAPIYPVTEAGQTALRENLAAFVPEKSCVLEVGATLMPGMPIPSSHCQSEPFILPAQFSEMTVRIYDDMVYDYTLGNGWQVKTDTSIELTGGACTRWKKLDVSLVEFVFQCWFG